MRTITKKVWSTNLLRYSKIPTRIFLSFAILSIVPLIILGQVATKQSSVAMESKIGTYSAEIMKLLQQTIRVETQKVEILSNQIIYNPVVQQALVNYHSLNERSKMTLTMDINELLADKSTLLEYISTMRIYTMNGDVLYDLGYKALRENDPERWMEEINASTGKEVWTYATTTNKSECIVYGRIIYSQSDSTKPLGYILLAIDESMISNLYRNIDMGANASIFILDTGGTIISSRDPNMKIGVDHEQAQLLEQIEENRKLSSPHLTLELDSNKTLAAYAYDPETDWYVTSLVPYSYLQKETNMLKQFLIVINVIIAACCLVIALWISYSISLPLLRLVRYMKRVASGDVQGEIQDMYPDELGYLTRSFNKMLEDIRGLIGQVKSEQRLKRETEIQMLQAQINPHFLFNTLNSLKWTAMLSQADSVSNGLSALAELLRNTIVDKKEFITLRQEVRNIQNYVTILRTRYGSAFSLMLDIPEPLYDCMTLKFILQPIVENAIIHGVGGMESGGIVLVSCKQDHDMIRISIKDNGAGIQTSRMEDVLHKEQHNKLSGIGVNNVAERIRLNYGEEYGLSINSKLGEGTEVTLTLPYVMNAGGEEDEDAESFNRR